MAATIGDETKIGAFVEIQKNATIGRRCKISSHTFICEGVTIEDHVFIGHGVTFINDLVSARDDRGRRAADRAGLEGRADARAARARRSVRASTILANVVIGEHAIVGAGSVVTQRRPGTTPSSPATRREFCEAWPTETGSVE